MDQIPKAVKGSVQSLLDKKDEMNIQDQVCEILDLNRVKDRNVEDLSGKVLFSGERSRTNCVYLVTIKV